MGCCESTQVLPRQLEESSKLGTNRPVTVGLGKHQFIAHKRKSLRSDYTVIKLLGEGGFGQVFLVKDKRTGVMKALKEISTSQIDSDQIERVQQEVEILKLVVKLRQDHPNIMRIHELIQTTRSFCVVSEYLSGGELFSKIVESSSFDETRAAFYMHEILVALAYLHEKGIIHRDLKPENIMFDKPGSEGRLKIIDFGVSVRLKPETDELLEAIGTEFYIAPEVFDNQYNTKADVWSAGVILYVMLCKK